MEITVLFFAGRNLLALFGAYILIKIYVLQYLKRKKFNGKTLIISLLISILTLILIIGSIPFIRDIPNIITNNYLTADIETIGWSKDPPNKYDTRNIRVQNLDTGDIFLMKVRYTSIDKGERYRIIYLPHTGWAKIITKME